MYSDLDTISTHRGVGMSSIAGILAIGDGTAKFSAITATSIDMPVERAAGVVYRSGDPIHMETPVLGRWGGGGGGIPFHVFGRKYTEGTTLGHMRTTL